MYADDLKIYRKIINMDDCYLLQQDLDKLYEWSIENKLYFNISKCHALSSFSRKKILLMYDYTIDGTALSRVTYVRDLGITYDSELTFREHICNISSRACKMYGFIVRNCR